MEEMHMTNQQTAKLILDRAKPLFKREYNVQYRIKVVFDHYDHQFNFYMIRYKPGHITRVTPLHHVERTWIADLEEILNLIEKDLKLTIVFAGFEGIKWDSRNSYIQRPKRKVG